MSEGGGKDEEKDEEKDEKTAQDGVKHDAAQSEMWTADSMRTTSLTQHPAWSNSKPDEHATPPIPPTKQHHTAGRRSGDTRKVW